MKDLGLAEFDQSEQSTATELCRFGGVHCARSGTVWGQPSSEMGCGVGFAGRTQAHRRADRRYASAAVGTIPQEHISDDLPVPQVVKENLARMCLSRQKRPLSW